MTMDELTPLAPDESLYAFMDGELDQQNEQRLFDELAVNRELRTEMKDVLSIRSAIHRDILFPSPNAEAGILAATGLAPSATATIAAGGRWSSLAPYVYSAGGMLIGAVAVFLLMRSARVDDAQMVTALPVAPEVMTMELPIAGRSTMVMPSPDVPRIVYVYRDRDVVPPAPSTVSDPVQNLEVVASDLAVTNVDAPTTSPAYALTTGTTSTMQSMLAMPTSNRSMIPVQLRMRSLPSGVPSNEATPASIREAFLPNAAFAFTVPLNEQHRIGVELASESFRQVFNGTYSGHPVTYTQTPTLFWMGATYQYTPMELSFMEGLRPFAEVTAGMAFNQGPLTHAAVGLSYAPSGPISFSIGINGAALFYQHDQTWYSSTKWGITYGLSVDLGRLP